MALGQAVDRHTDRCEAYLMGRVLYDQWSQYWPDNDNDEFANFINPIPKYVLSTTLEDATWEGTTILRSVEELRDLRDRTAGTIGMSGSLSTLRSLLEAGLLDELDLLVDPIVVSGERRWTDELGRTPLELVSSESLPTGVLHVVYRPAA
jgi:dihydrofolate reductase